MPKSKAFHRNILKSGRNRSKGASGQSRNTGGRSYFTRHFHSWTEWPAWKRYSLASTIIALGLVMGGAALQLIRHAAPATPPVNASTAIDNGIAREPSFASHNTPSSPGDSDGGDYFKNAKKALELGQFEESAAQYGKILETNPSSEDAHFGLAVALARQGRDDEAVKEYEEALRIMPDYAEVHNNLGNLLAKQGKLSEALDHFQTAIKITPDYATALNNMGTVLVRQGRWEQALESFEKAVKASPDYAAAHFNLGNSLMRDRNPAAAAHEFEEVLRLQPDFKSAADALALARKETSITQSNANSALGPMSQ